MRQRRKLLAKASETERSSRVSSRSPINELFDRTASCAYLSIGPCGLECLERLAICCDKMKAFVERTLL